MPLQTASGMESPVDAYTTIRSFAATAKSVANGCLTTLQAPVDTTWVFWLLDQVNSFISTVNGLKGVNGLDTYATAQGYPTTLSADVTTAANAAQAIINWVVTNF